MKARLKTTFERYGVIGRIEDAEMYKKVKNGTSRWKETAYPRITHIQIPKEVFERLLELDRSNQKQSEGKWIEHPHFDFEGGYSGANYECSNCHYDDIYDLDDMNFCPNCGAKMKGGAE